MKLNLNLEDVTYENYSEIVKEIDNFKAEMFKKYDSIKKEKGKELIKSLLKEPIRGVEECTIYSIDREFIQDLFCESIMEMGFDSYGEYEKEELEDDTFENETFMLRPYSWNCNITMKTLWDVILN